MEEFQVFDKTTLENKNLCANCNKQLNVTPIFCVERNQRVDEICGRCVHVVDGYGKNRKWRQYAYENFGKFLTFPCSNKAFGCNTVLYWDDVLSHEKICTFQGLKCPIAQNMIFPDETCTWKGNVKSFHEHVDECHKNCILNPPQIDWRDNKKNVILFTNVGSQIITIVIKYEKESTYYCLLMMNGTDIESQCYRYQLELFNEDKSNSIILRKSRLEPLSFMMESLNNTDKVLEIDLIKIKQMLKHTKLVIGRFGIVKKPKKEIAAITGGINFEPTIPITKPKDNKIIDENMLLELECPVCNEHMIPPIFICKTGHSICSRCKSRVSTCPNCRDYFSGARNFTLEKLTARVNYPCRNREQGCPFVTTSDKIVDHQLNCELSDNPCLLDCGWQGQRVVLYNHLKTEHPQVLFDGNTLQIHDTENDEVVHFLYEHGELFRFSVLRDFDMDTKNFNIQQVGFVEGDPKFHYQMQIIDHSPHGLNLSFTNICRRLTDLDTAHATGISLPWHLLLPFIFEEKYYYYKIIITKI